MVVLILESAPTSLRGHLTRWLLQLHPGVFIGHLSARVRDLLWGRIENSIRDGYALLITPANTEQGFTIRVHGKGKRDVVDFEGLFLTRQRKG